MEVVVAAAVAAFETPLVTACAAFATPVVAVVIAEFAAFATPVVALLIAEFAAFAAFATPAVAAPKILFLEPRVVLPERFFEREFRVVVGPLLKREIRLLFCGEEMFFEVNGAVGAIAAGAARLFFLFIAFVMFEARLLISIVIV